jgi:aspartate carbamoyltransferase regulatory subunit
MLKLDQTDGQVTIGFNLESKKYGKKGIIKASNQFFENRDANKIALIAPSATLIQLRIMRWLINGRLRFLIPLSSLLNALIPIVSPITSRLLLNST